MSKFWLLGLSGLFLMNLALAEKRALVIGIRYDNMSGNEIPQCVFDAQAMAKLLEDKYGFARVTLVTAEEATRAHLTAEFKKLVEQAQRGDEIVVYYSGHGTQVDDQEGGDESDGLDEAIVTYDEEYIRDDDLGQWTGSLSQKGARVVVWFDSCYSGSGLKAFDLATAGAHKHFQKKYIYRKEWQKQVRERNTNLVRVSVEDNNRARTPTTGEDRVCEGVQGGSGAVVFFAACSENEVSWTLNNKDHSAFTYHLLRAYENNLQGDLNRDGTMSFAEAFEFVRAAVGEESLPQKQNPTVEGNYELKGQNSLFPGLFAVRARPLPPPAPRTLDLAQLLEKLAQRHLCVPTYSKWRLDISLLPESKVFSCGDYVNVKITPGDSGYLLLISLNDKGQATLLFPNADAQDNRVEKGKTIIIPPQDGTWAIQIQPPTGREWIIAYLFEKNPLAGYSLPDTFEENFFMNADVEAVHGHLLEEESIASLLSALSDNKAVVTRPNVIEKWTKASVSYQTR